MIRLVRDRSTKHNPFPKGMRPILDTLRGPGLVKEPITDLPALQKMLRGGDLVDRNVACVGLAELAKKDPEKAREAVPDLIEAFNKWGALTKAVITETFVELQDSRALPCLIRNAESRHLELRKRIEWALRNIPAVVLKQIE